MSLLKPALGKDEDCSLAVALLDLVVMPQGGRCNDLRRYGDVLVSPQWCRT